MENTFKPYGNYILIKRDEDITERDGIVLPNPVEAQTGMIVGVGDGSEENPMDLEKGVKALFKRGIIQDVSKLVKEDGTFIVIDKNDVLATY